jgi:phosphoesterase RecJ-like protein
MCAKSSANAFEQVADRLAAASRLVCVSHERPDGDALGSMAATALAAEAAGKRACVVVDGELPAKYASLLDGVRSAGPERFGELAAEADCIAVIDTCAREQLTGVVAVLDASRDKVVAVDHHLTTDDIGSARWIDPSAAAAGVMVLELLDRLGWPVGSAVVRALATAVLTDTGWMRFSNTDARALRAIARLVECGADLDQEHRRIYQNDRPERLRLRGRALEGVEFLCSGRLAVTTLRRADFERTGATDAETEDIVNEPMSVGSVEVSVLVVETADGVRASLRSKGGVDVSRIAGGFGGGGHAQAAGCRRAAPVEQFRDDIVAACEEALRPPGRAG